MRANVYFTREITPEKVVELYRACLLYTSDAADEL